jgi:hypothetical protein
MSDTSLAALIDLRSVHGCEFEISKDKAGKFRFHLKAPNGEIIAASQGYASRPRIRGSAPRTC